MNERPLGIPYGIWFILLWLSFSAFTRLTWLRLFLDSEIVSSTLVLFILDMIVLSIMLFVIYGILKAQSWAWIVLIFFIFIDMAISYALSNLNGGLTPAIKTIFGIILVFYLFQPGVKAYFNIIKK